MTDAESGVAIEVGEVADGELDGVLDQAVRQELAGNGLLDHFQAVAGGEVDAELLGAALFPGGIEQGEAETELLPGSPTGQIDSLGVGASVGDARSGNLDDVVGQRWAGQRLTGHRARGKVGRGARGEPQVFDGLTR